MLFFPADPSLRGGHFVTLHKHLNPDPSTFHPQGCGLLWINARESSTGLRTYPQILWIRVPCCGLFWGCGRGAAPRAVDKPRLIHILSTRYCDLSTNLSTAARTGIRLK